MLMANFLYLSCPVFAQCPRSESPKSRFNTLSWTIGVHISGTVLFCCMNTLQLALCTINFNFSITIVHAEVTNIIIVGRGIKKYKKAPQFRSFLTNIYTEPALARYTKSCFLKFRANACLWTIEVCVDPWQFCFFRMSTFLLVSASLVSRAAVTSFMQKRVTSSRWIWAL